MTNTDVFVDPRRFSSSIAAKIGLRLPSRARRVKKLPLLRTSRASARWGDRHGSSWEPFVAADPTSELGLPDHDRSRANFPLSRLIRRSHASLKHNIYASTAN